MLNLRHLPGSADPPTSKVYLEVPYNCESFRHVVVNGNVRDVISRPRE